MRNITDLWWANPAVAVNQDTQSVFPPDVHAVMDHGKKAGILHVAPGKKQWTWGCGDFGQAWDRNLTDEDGPYIERKLFGTTGTAGGFLSTKGGPASPNGEAGPFFQKTRRTVAASDKAAAARLALETRSR